MTIIKQTGVQSNGHMKNLRGYINDDRKVLVRDSLNMDGCTNPKRWAHHMWMTREAYGHNKAARRVRDKKTGELKEAKNTILFHQILGFNPDECDLNGGRHYRSCFGNDFRHRKREKLNDELHPVLCNYCGRDACGIGFVHDHGSGAEVCGGNAAAK